MNKSCSKKSKVDGGRDVFANKTFQDHNLKIEIQKNKWKWGENIDAGNVGTQISHFLELIYNESLFVCLIWFFTSHLMISNL